MRKGLCGFNWPARIRIAVLDRKPIIAPYAPVFDVCRMLRNSDANFILKANRSDIERRIYAAGVETLRVRLRDETHRGTA